MSNGQPYFVCQSYKANSSLLHVCKEMLDHACVNGIMYIVYNNKNNIPGLKQNLCRCGTREKQFICVHVKQENRKKTCLNHNFY